MNWHILQLLVRLLNKQQVRIYLAPQWHLRRDLENILEEEEEWFS